MWANDNVVVPLGYNHLQGNYASKIRVDNLFSFSVKNRDYFAFLHKWLGHRDVPHKTVTTGTYGHPTL